jgi:hypothetical protein
LPPHTTQLRSGSLRRVSSWGANSRTAAATLRAFRTPSRLCGPGWPRIEQKAIGSWPRLWHRCSIAIPTTSAAKYASGPRSTARTYSPAMRGRGVTASTCGHWEMSNGSSNAWQARWFPRSCRDERVDWTASTRSAAAFGWLLRLHSGSEAPGLDDRHCPDRLTEAPAWLKAKRARGCAMTGGSGSSVAGISPWRSRRSLVCEGRRGGATVSLRLRNATGKRCTACLAGEAVINVPIVSLAHEAGGPFPSSPRAKRPTLAGAGLLDPPRGELRLRRGIRRSPVGDARPSARPRAW